MAKWFEHRHVVLFEETNVVGNVYFVNHLRWQGHCREMFLRRRAPSVLRELENGLALVTMRCSCEYLDELRAFDEVTVRMRLAAVHQNRITFAFEYRVGERLVARGEQQVAAMRKTGDGLEATPLPSELAQALAEYSE
jgi:enediyne biosynthesis thioesterase